jgi:rhodanese-related sulfurtransferase
MKRLHLILIGLLLIPSLFLTSCDQGDMPESVKPELEVLTAYMATNNLDLDKVDTNINGLKFVVPAPESADLNNFLADYYIIDIRSSDAYNAAHISGAKNVLFKDILTEGAAADAAGKPALVVCYTGQTACYATALMRMYGYTNTRALKWGMSGWNAKTAVNFWDKGIGDIAQGHANWSYGSAPESPGYSLPTSESTVDDGLTIIQRRVKNIVENVGFKTAKGADVLASPNDYFINNYFSATDYTNFGHINGAYRIDPLSVSNINLLDPSAKIVTYCYTGQTSAVITAWLRVLGYDAYSLTYGMNGLYNSNTAWTSNKWVIGSTPKDLPLIEQ